MKGFALIGIVAAIIIVTGSVSFAEFSSGRSISIYELKFTQVKESIGDFFFSVRSTLTSDMHGKLKLYSERSEELKDRQVSWMKTKEMALEQIGNMSLSEKREVVGLLNYAHAKLIKDEMKISNEVSIIRLKASEINDPDLTMEAEKAFENIESSAVFLGLNADFSRLNNISINESFSINKSGVLGKMNITLEEAKKLVEDQTGVKASETDIQSKGNIQFFVIKGSKKEVKNGSEASKSYEVWVNSETGKITSISTKSEARSNNGSAVATSEATGDETETFTETSRDGSSASSVARSKSSSRK